MWGVCPGHHEKYGDTAAWWGREQKTHKFKPPKPSLSLPKAPLKPPFRTGLKPALPQFPFPVPSPCPLPSFYPQFPFPKLQALLQSDLLQLL